jgi:hypothetical protein
MNTISAESVSALILTKLYRQISIPNCFPQLESVEGRPEKLLRLLINAAGWCDSSVGWRARATCRASAEELPLDVVYLDMDRMYE